MKFDYRLVAASLFTFFVFGSSGEVLGQNSSPLDNRVGHVVTYQFQHVRSGEYLIQHWHGRREDKRTARVWPFIANDPVYNWVLRPTGDGWNYIVNLKTGLVLTQDSGGASTNVSDWGRLPPNHPHSRTQQWQIRGGPAVTAIINRHSRKQLGQEYGGTRRDEKNVMVLPDKPNTGSWRMIQSRRVDLAKLTIERIKAIKVSSGQDANTKVLFQAIETAAELGAGAATGGASAGLSTVAKTAAKTAIRNGVRAGSKVALRQGRQLVTRQYIKDQIKDDVSGRISDRIREEALKAGNQITKQQADSFVELAFNKFYGESPDQLEIRVNGISVWPNGGRNHTNIKSQQTKTVNTEFLFERQKGVAIQLFEYDSGSSDDSLGWITLDTRNLVRRERFEDALVVNKSEGSVYAVTFTVEPLWPQGGTKPQSRNQSGASGAATQTAALPTGVYEKLVGEYVSQTGGGVNWYRGVIESNGKVMWWANQALNTWSLTPDLINGRLLTGPKNPWTAGGVKEFRLVIRNGQIAGFNFGRDFFQKQPNSPPTVAALQRLAQQQGRSASQSRTTAALPPARQQAARPPAQQRQQPGAQTQQSNQRRTPQQIAAANAQLQAEVVGNYARHPVESPWHRGAILGGENGQFKWHNRARRSWTLFADHINQRLLNGKDSPYFNQGPREFKLVRRNGQYVGFHFGNDFYQKLTEPPVHTLQSARQQPQQTQRPQRRQSNQQRSALTRMATGYGKVQSLQGTFEANYELYGRDGQTTMLKINVEGKILEVRLSDFSADKTQASGNLVPCEGGTCPCNLRANEQKKQIFATCTNNAHPEYGQMQFGIQLN